MTGKLCLCHVSDKAGHRCPDDLASRSAQGHPTLQAARSDQFQVNFRKNRVIRELVFPCSARWFSRNSEGNLSFLAYLQKVTVLAIKSDKIMEARNYLSCPEISDWLFFWFEEWRSRLWLTQEFYSLKGQKNEQRNLYVVKSHLSIYQKVD